MPARAARGTRGASPERRRPERDASVVASAPAWQKQAPALTARHVQDAVALVSGFDHHALQRAEARTLGDRWLGDASELAQLRHLRCSSKDNSAGASSLCWMRSFTPTSHARTIRWLVHWLGARPSHRLAAAASAISEGVLAGCASSRSKACLGCRIGARSSSWIASRSRSLKHGMAYGPCRGMRR